MASQVLLPVSGFTMSNGKFANVTGAPMFPLQTQTATATGDIFEVGDRLGLRLTLNVTAASGTTPTLDVIVETSDDPTFATNARTLMTFTQKTTTGTQRLSAAGMDRYIRPKATIGGTTPSFTFSLDGEAV